MTRALYRLAKWCADHAWWVVAAWLAVLASVTAADVLLPPPGQQDFTLSGSDSAEALTLMSRAFPGTASEAAPLVIGAEIPLDSGEGAAVVASVADAVAGLPVVAEVESPAEDPDRFSESADIAVIGVTVADRYVGESDAARQILDTAREAAPPQYGVAIGGLPGEALSTPDTLRSEAIGLLAAVVVLVLTLRRMWAAAVPLISAMITIGIGIPTINVVARLVLIPEIAPVLGTMLGIGVGIDYALFFVVRHRSLLARGFPVADAAGRTAGTSGAGIVFAGITLILAVCGLALTGISFLAWMGYAAALVVAVAVALAVTLVPAMVGLLGDRVQARSVDARHRGDEHLDHGLWARIADRVTARPWLFTALASGLLLAMAAPMLTMTFGQTDAGNLPPSTTARQANDLMVQAFGPGSTGPLAITSAMNRPATSAEEVTDPAGLAAEGAQGSGAEARLPGDGGGPTDPRAEDPRLVDLSEVLAATPGVDSVSQPFVSPDGGVAVISVTPSTGPADPATRDLVVLLREDVLPAANAGADMVSHVGGRTSLMMDVTTTIGERLPWFIGGVATFSALLLMIAYRSLVIPVKAAAMNLISISAAYGVVVAIFQWGWGAELIGLSELMPIETFVPMIMFAVLFGLSMDYEVFLLTAFREHWSRTGDMKVAVRRGLTDTGRVVTSAATIMVVVFASFVLVDDPLTKMFGVGLATAVLVDATIVRSLLVPALMVLAARWTWWLPGWLDRLLPHLQVEGDPAALESIDRPRSGPEGGHRADGSWALVPGDRSSATPLWAALAGMLLAWFLGSRMNDTSPQMPYQDLAIAVSALIGSLTVWLPRAVPGLGRSRGGRLLGLLGGALAVALVVGALRAAIPYTERNPGQMAAWGLLAVTLLVAGTRVRGVGIPVVLGALAMAVTLGVGGVGLTADFGVLLRNALLPAVLAGLTALFLSHLAELLAGADHDSDGTEEVRGDEDDQLAGVSR